MLADKTVIPVVIVGRYVGLTWGFWFVQAEVTSVDNLIRLLGGKCKMRLEVNALGLFVLWCSLLIFKQCVH